MDTRKPMTEITLSDADRRRVAAYTENGLRNVEHYTRLPGAKEAPRKFIGTLSRSAYLALTNAERLAIVRESLLEANLAEALSKRARFVAAKQEQRNASRAVTAEPEHTPADPADHAELSTAGSWVVPCADGCGALLPANGPRAVVAYVDGHRPKRKRRKPKRVHD